MKRGYTLITAGTTRSFLAARRSGFWTNCDEPAFDVVSARRDRALIELLVDANTARSSRTRTRREPFNIDSRLLQ